MHAFCCGRHAWRRCALYASEYEAGCQTRAATKKWQYRSVASGALGDEVEENVRADLDELASQKPHPVSLQQVLGTRKKSSAAKFIHSEVPIRLAERVRAIEHISEFTEINELKTVHSRLIEAFRMLRADKPDYGELRGFTRVCKQIVVLEQPIIQLAAKGMWHLRNEFPEKYTEEFADTFLNHFLLNRVGSTVLIGQYLAHPRGIIDPKCDPLDACNEAATAVEYVTKKVGALTPLITVEAHSAVEGDHEDPRFSYIPSFIKYIITELLKNSSRATVELAGTQDEVNQRPISVVICADEHRVAIRVSDRARGIPFDVGKRVWSYSYTTADESSPLAGYGVGLPLSRLYAWYLGTDHV